MVSRAATRDGPLPRCFIQQYARRDCRVQAFDRSGAGNCDHPIGHCGQLLRHSIALIADEQRHGTGQVHEIGRLRAMR
jgi:hypothetical protein